MLAPLSVDVMIFVDPVALFDVPAGIMTMAGMIRVSRVSAVERIRRRRDSNRTESLSSCRRFRIHERNSMSRSHENPVAVLVSKRGDIDVNGEVCRESYIKTRSVEVMSDDVGSTSRFSIVSVAGIKSETFSATKTERRNELIEPEPRVESRGLAPVLIKTLFEFKAW